MTANETVRPQRRAGTFTLGVVLVAAGLGMLASLFWPALDIGWLLKLSPLILVALGVEVLLAARGGGKVKYDWVGMILCFVLVGAGLTMYAAAWYWENGEYWNAMDSSRWADETSYRMDYRFFNGFDSHTLYLEAGETLECDFVIWRGCLEVEISDGDGAVLYEGTPLEGAQRFEVPRSGLYTILVHGHDSGGSFFFQAVGAPPADEEVPEEGEPPAGTETPEER